MIKSISIGTGLIPKPKFLVGNISANFSNIISQKQVKRYKYKFSYGIGFRPHPNKQAYGGDDSYIATQNLIAVADGVGSGTESQFDPSMYAKRMMEFIQKIYKNQKKMSIQDPTYAVRQALKLVKVFGATTITILTVHPQTGKLNSYYIGDSLYGFFRKQQVEMVTPQMVSFNKPYQIGQLNRQVQNGYQNQYSFSQIGDDLIVVGSDGLWDNLSLDRIHYQSRGPGSKFKNQLPKSLTQIAQSVAQIAYRYSLTNNYKSPIYLRAQEQGISFPKQGKVDDITVILAKIVKQSLSKGQTHF